MRQRQHKFWWLEGVNIGNYIFEGIENFEYSGQIHSLYVFSEYDENMIEKINTIKVNYSVFKKMTQGYDLSEYRRQAINANMRKKRSKHGKN